MLSFAERGKLVLAIKNTVAAGKISGVQQKSTSRHWPISGIMIRHTELWKRLSSLSSNRYCWLSVPHRIKHGKYCMQSQVLTLRPISYQLAYGRRNFLQATRFFKTSVGNDINSSMIKDFSPRQSNARCFYAPLVSNIEKNFSFYLYNGHHLKRCICVNSICSKENTTDKHTEKQDLVEAPTESYGELTVGQKGMPTYRSFFSVKLSFNMTSVTTLSSLIGKCWLEFTDTIRSSKGIPTYSQHPLISKTNDSNILYFKQIS